MSGFVATKIEEARDDPSNYAWSPQEYAALLERVREEPRQQARARAWELAKRQGVRPIRDIKELQEDFWPEDESVDEFLAWVRATRQQDKIGVDE